MTRAAWLAVSVVAILVAVLVWRVRTPDVESVASEPAAAKQATPPRGSTDQPPAQSTGVSALPSASYAKSDNLLALIESNAAAAQRNDPTALGITARAFEECTPLLITPSYLHNFEESAGQYGQRKDLALAYARRFAARCSDFAQLHVGEKGATTAAIAAAASAGDPWSKAFLLSQSMGMADPVAAKADVEAIIASRDPEAIGQLADAMGARAQGRSDIFGDLSGSDTYVYAWQLASCDMGRECGEDSVFRMKSCLFGGICGEGSYRDFLSGSVLTADEIQNVDAAEREVLSKIRSTQGH